MESTLQKERRMQLTSLDLIDRPLPPTPVDDEDSNDESQIPGKAVPQMHVPDFRYGRTEADNQRILELVTAQMDEKKKRMEAEGKRMNELEKGHNASQLEGQFDAGEGSSRQQTELTESMSAYPGPDTKNLDIYGNSDDEGSEHGDPVSRNSEEDTTRSLPEPPRRMSSKSAPHYPIYTGDAQWEGTPPGGDSSLVSRAAHPQLRPKGSQQTEVAVPRWQPDAEVTFCPICRTQFSFFVRKHHCRKCGRVVCNSCSPHRITIPHQYIVQPPTVIDPTAIRPTLDPSRVGSQSTVTSLGGGERVRLCNPCVPDPNIAPPQTRSDHHRQHQTHSRSASSAAALYSPSNRGSHNASNARSNQSHTRPPATSFSVADQRAPSSYNGRDGSNLRPSALDTRSRSSTLGSAREALDLGVQSSRTAETQDPYAGLIPPFNETPHTIQLYRDTNPSTNSQSFQRSQAPPPAQRRLHENDMCWVCFEELPSRTLLNFAELRESHVQNCLDRASRRGLAALRSNNTNQTTTPTSNPIQTPQSTPITTHPSSSSSTSATTTTTNTTESPSARRERQHADIVLGKSLLPASSYMHRLISYKASEKDCIDDAECTICLEEFEVGQEMGRLECLCRYHLDCIRGWYVQKPGKCPVHGVDY